MQSTFYNVFLSNSLTVQSTSFIVFHNDDLISLNFSRIHYQNGG